jgi:hypothetical protein
MLRKVIFILIVVTITINVNAQIVGEKMRELFEDAEYFFGREDYEEAVYYYRQLYSSDTNNANLAFKIGSCYLNIPGREVLAIPYFEAARQQITSDYDDKSINERKAPLHTLFYLGNSYRMNDQIDEALNVYNDFTSSPMYEGNYNITVVENEIIASERAKTIIDFPIDVKLEPISDDRINTSSQEYNPVISGDGKHLVFIRKLKFYDAIFYCQKLENGDWSEPRNINPEIVSDGNHYPTGFTFTGDTLLFVEDADFNKDIYITARKNGRWQPLKALDKPINSRANESFASFSNDGKSLLFVSDRWGGEGDLDLYVISKTENGEWGKPLNLGPLVNTPYNEHTAYFTNNNQTIFFSSQGHHKMGGYDVFYTNFENGKWSNPFNVGYPVSTTKNNLHYQPMSEGNKLIYSEYDIETNNEDIIICHIKSALNLVNFDFTEKKITLNNQK